MLFFMVACVQEIETPFLGDCAQYPESNYDFGQVDIGTCISGPSDMHFIDREGEIKLLVSNANPYLNFSSGSVLMMDWDSVDLTIPTQYSHEIVSQSILLDNFSGEIESNGEWVTLSNRYSDQARDLEQADRLYQFAFEEGTLVSKDDIAVGADPIGTVYDKSTGYVFVANQSSKDISIVDTTLEQMSAIPPWPEQSLSTVSYDGEGHAALAQLEPLSEEILGNIDEIPTLTDDLFSLTWIEGSSSLWVPEDSGWIKLQYFGPNQLYESEFGPELNAENNFLVGSIEDPFFFGNAMVFADQTTLYSALQGDAGSWTYDPNPLATFEVEELGGFAYGQLENDSFILYSARTTKGWSLYQHNLNENTEDIELLFLEDVALRDPYVAYDSQAKLWHLFYSLEDPDFGWQIWRAYSLDGSTWVFDDEPMFLDATKPYASPAITISEAGIHMWYTRLEEQGWEYIHAFSRNGHEFTEIEVLENRTLEQPQRLAISHSPALQFRLSSEVVGNITQLEPASVHISTSHGWTASIITGAHASETLFSEDSAGGVQVDSIHENTAYMTITNRSGLRQIATGTILPDNSIVAEQIIFDADSDQYAPVIWQQEETYHLVFTQIQDGNPTLVKSTSSDGQNWGATQQILQPEGSDIEANQFFNNTLWVSQEDYNGWNLYTFDEGSNEGLVQVFSRGDIGSWDDNGIRDAYLEKDGEYTHLYYSGFDGQQWQIGYAYQQNTLWMRPNEESAIIGSSGMFFSEGTRRPIRIPEGSHFVFSGIHDSVSRVGSAAEFVPGHMRVSYSLPKTGDQLHFETESGSDEENTIPLDVTINGVTLAGNGLSMLSIDTERGFLFVTSRQLPYIMVIDIQDNSTEDFHDRNYLKLETTLSFATTSGATGFRQTLAHDGRLYALNDAPEAVFVIDIDLIEDNAVHELMQAPALDLLQASRGLEVDEGADTRSSVGPSRLALHPNGHLLAVSNFNTNSISFYDLRLGRSGSLIYEIPLHAENPHALSFSPEGLQLIVSTYTGEMDGFGSHSELVIIDTDETSPTYLNILTRIKNR